MENIKKITPPSILVQIFCLILPFALAKIILSFISWNYTPEHSKQLFSLGVLSFFGLGKFIVFAPLIPIKGVDFKILYSPFELAFMVTFMDTMVGILITYNFYLLNKIYWIGPKLEGIREDCHYLLKSNKWMTKFAVLGIVAFVSFPVAGTGAIGGAFLANILGFRRITAVFWIFIGGLVGSMGMATGAVYLQARLKEFLETPVFFFGGIAVGVILIILAGLKLRSMIQEQKQKENAQ